MAAEALTLLGCGNPLLDISADVPMELCERYGVTMNNAILAEDKHLPLYPELVKDFDVKYIAGGATQNSVRVAQWILGDAGTTAIVGCVGDDDFGRQLEAAATADGVRPLYQKDPAAPTGTCAVLVHEHERSLVANLSAANNYKVDHFRSEPIQGALASARFVYSSGFFLTVSVDSMVEAGKHCADTGSYYMMNLAAPFLCQFFKDQMHSVMPYCDFVFGNESEGAAYAENNGLDASDLSAVALSISKLPKASGSHARVVIITQGSGDVIVAKDGKVELHPTPAIPAEDMIDVNGAGDAFVGGFIARFSQGDSLADSVKCGQWAAGHIIRRSGCTFDRTVRYSA